jgi:hypothetical protein
MSEPTAERVERVAQAIWEANNGPWDFVSPEGREALRREARAAIDVTAEHRRPVPNAFLLTELLELYAATEHGKRAKLHAEISQLVFHRCAALAADLNQMMDVYDV